MTERQPIDTAPRNPSETATILHHRDPGPECTMSGSAAEEQCEYLFENLENPGHPVTVLTWGGSKLRMECGKCYMLTNGEVEFLRERWWKEPKPIDRPYKFGEDIWNWFPRFKLTECGRPCDPPQ